MRFFTRTSGLAILVMAITIAVYSQSQSQQQSIPSSPAAQSSGQDAQQAMTLVVKVVDAGGEMVLKDEATNTTYKVDNSDKLKRFAGKTVKVTGTKDPSTNTIHVASIEPNSNPSNPN